jgi:hypothetical protein
MSFKLVLQREWPRLGLDLAFLESRSVRLPPVIGEDSIAKWKRSGGGSAKCSPYHTSHRSAHLWVIGGKLDDRRGERLQGSRPAK